MKQGLKQGAKTGAKTRREGEKEKDDVEIIDSKGTGAVGQGGQKMTSSGRGRFLRGGDDVMCVCACGVGCC